MSAEVWFKFYPSDWIGGTACLSASEKGVYATLLALIYDASGPVARDDARLSRQCGLPKAGFKKAVEALISLGKIEFDGQWLSNSRAKIELTERENKIASAREGARVTNEKKINKSDENSRSSERYSEQSADADRAVRARAVPEPEEDNSLRSLSSARQPTKRGARLSPDWQPTADDWASAVRLLAPDGAARALEKFRDYWAAKAGAGGVKLDWDATWRNWARTESERGRVNGNGQHRRTVHDAARDLHESVAAALAEPRPPILSIASRNNRGD